MKERKLQTKRANGLRRRGVSLLLSLSLVLSGTLPSLAAEPSDIILDENVEIIPDMGVSGDLEGIPDTGLLEGIEIVPEGTAQETDSPEAGTPGTEAGAPEMSAPGTGGAVPGTTTPGTEAGAPEMSAPGTGEAVPGTTMPGTETGAPEISAPETESGAPGTAVPGTETDVPGTSVPGTESGAPGTAVPGTETDNSGTIMPGMESGAPETTAPGTESGSTETAVPETGETAPGDIILENTQAVSTAAELLAMVQQLIDALPDTVTEENAEEVKAQLSAIDEAKADLTEEELETLDITNYMAAVNALLELEGMAGANEAELLADGSYDISTGSVTISEDGSYTITGTTTKNTITVKKDVNATVTLKNVNINLDGTTTYDAAFKIEDDSAGDVIVILEGENLLHGYRDHAGLEKNGIRGSLTIKGSGTLNAIGDLDGAGIGGTEGKLSGNITILSGTVNATVGWFSAGIGGGMRGTGSNITIRGGNVTARDEGYGAGIGGGYQGSGSKITIAGGDVTAIGGAGSAGIGGGSDGTDSSAGGSGSEIIISAGTVNATGGPGAAGIGGGRGASGSNITIEGGDVTATGGGEGAGIGGGEGGGNGVGENTNGSNITISGGNVTASGGTGIGGGYKGNGSDITISGGNVTARSEGYGAGIGGGYKGNGSNIIITGGTVTAQGDNYFGGAGIGGGHGGGGGSVVIQGGVVTAIGRNGGAGIGIGKNGTDFTFSTGENGNAFIRASSITGGENTEGWSGVIFQGDSGMVYGSPILNRDVTVPAGAILTVPGESTLTVNAGVTLDVQGSMKGNGTLAGDGSFIGNIAMTFGSFLVSGTVRKVSYSGGVLTVQDGAEIVVTAAAGADRKVTDHILVSKNASASITLNGLKIDVGGMDQTAAFEISDGSAGNVTVILAGSCTLKSGSQCAGLQKNGTAGSLTIQGSGSLRAEGGASGAGIGGGAGGSCSNIIIGSGVGTVTATGGECAAGIGGGAGGSGSEITIDGGTVRAAGGRYGAGIGGGQNAGGRTVIINGGDVTATGGSSGAGIGGGNEGGNSDITIRSGHVTAVGGEYSAGIGGGAGGSAAILIQGGTVSATGGNLGAGIGTGQSGSGSVTISGGDVKAIGGNGGADIGVGKNGGDFVFSTGENGNAIITASNITGGNHTEAWDCVLLQGNSYMVYGSPTLNSNFMIPAGVTMTITEGSTLTVSSGVELMNHGLLRLNGTLVNHGTISGSGKCWEELFYGDLRVYENGTKVTGYVTYDSAARTLTVLDGADVTISMRPGVDNTENGDRIVVAKDASARITLSGVDIRRTGTEAPFEIKANSTGDVTVVLADGTQNNLQSSAKGYAGLQKNGNDERCGTLYITGSGSLTASGGDVGAGIGGGGHDSNTRNIVIQGGTVTAVGGIHSPGIGCAGADECADADHIVIDGGTVNARGGEYGAGIGGGNQGDTSIIVNGGNVTAQGGSKGAGIGGGLGGIGVVTINGGTVNATGGESGSGIGGGRGARGIVSVNGGNITAAGGSSGAGIGGEDASGVILNGGVVRALAGAGGVGIGNPDPTATGAKICGLSTSPSLATASGLIIADSMNCTIETNEQYGVFRGVLLAGSEGRVYGDVTLSASVTIPADTKLLIPEGSSLKLAGGATLTNEGEIYEGGVLAAAPAGKGTVYYNISLIDCTVTGATEMEEKLYAPAGTQLTVASADPAKVWAGWKITLKKTGKAMVVSGDTFSMPDDGVTVKPIPAEATSLADAIVTAEDVTYNGKAQEPEVTVTLAGKVLVEGTDYTASYSNNRNAGRGTVTVTAIQSETAGYTGECSTTFAIAKAPLTIGQVNLVTGYYEPGNRVAELGYVEFIGLMQEDKRCWLYDEGYDGKIVGSHYEGTAEYEDDRVGSNKRASVRLWLTDTEVANNYYLTGDTATAYGPIERSELAIEEYIALTDKVYTYTGSQIIPDKGDVIVCKRDNHDLILDPGEYDIGVPDSAYDPDTGAYVDKNINVGTGEIHIQSNENGNYWFYGDTFGTFTILPAALEEATVTVNGSYGYDGTPKIPDVTVEWNGQTLIPDKDYTMTVFGNVEMTDSATVLLEGIGNFTGRVTKTFSIGKGIPEISFRDTYPLARRYDGTEVPLPSKDDLEITGVLPEAVNGIQVSFSWDRTPVEAGVYTLTVNLAETELTNAATFTREVRVLSAPVEITRQPVSPETVEAGCTEMPTLTVEAAAAGEGGVSYQWYQKAQTADGNDTLLEGATESSYTVPAGLTSGEYQYYCAVTCDGYTVESDVATVTVKQLFGVWVSSYLEPNGGSIANASGGGKFLEGDRVTVTAPAVDGCTFKGWYDLNKGWYDNQEAVSGNLSYTFVLTEHTNLIAVYTPNAKVTVTVEGLNNAMFYVDGDGTAQSHYGQNVAIGTRLQLTAKEPDKVSAWLNGSDKVIGTGATLEVTVTGSMTIKLSYKTDVENQAMVEYVSDYGQLLSFRSYNATQEITPPVGPSKLGYTFTGWDLSVEEIQKKIKAGERHITVRPVYEANEVSFTVTVKYPDGTLADDSYTGTEGSGLTVTAREIDGRVFAYWTDANGKILSYEQSYFVRVTSDVALTAHYEENAVEIRPVIAMTAMYASVVGGKNKVSFAATRSIPEDYTLVEHGILYGTDAALAGEDAMVLNGANVRKALSNNTMNNGVYTLNISVGTKTSMTVYGRGYMIVRNNRTNNLETVYSEIVSGSYEGLSAGN